MADVYSGQWQSCRGYFRGWRDFTSGFGWRTMLKQKKGTVLDNPCVQCYTKSLVLLYNLNYDICTMANALVAYNAMDYNLVEVYYVV